VVDRTILENEMGRQCHNCGTYAVIKNWKTKGKGPSPTMIIKCKLCERFFLQLFYLYIQCTRN
jgi:hypothetical protein